VNRISWLKSSVLAVVLGAALAAPVGAATPDAWITTKAKLTLLTTEGVSGTAIHVDTVLGRVTLYGKVPSGEEKARAESVTQKIEGVQSVRNLLQVVAPQHVQAVQLADDALKARIETVLQADPSLRDSRISVQSVNKGVVLLTGTAKTLSAHLRAVEVVSGMPGVQRVASEVQSPDTLADAEIWRKPTPQPATSKGSGVGEAASDMWITSATKMRLLADPRTPALDINVDTRAGIVTLFGIVSTQDAKAAAADDARKVSGVTRVVNELQVVSSAKQAGVKVRDEEMQGAVKKAFDTQDFKDVTVKVKNGVVRLTGTVPTGTRRLEAAVLARSIQGVRAVEDDLRIVAAV
jgi:hyperosmotically inducible periplasmic protein